MTKTTDRNKRYRKLFGWAFLLSVVALVVSSVPESLSSRPKSPNSSSNDYETSRRLEPPLRRPPEARARKPRSAKRIMSFFSVLTSVASLLGLFFTTVSTWRKEKREQQQAELDFERKRLELEKIRLEIGQSQKKETS